MEAALRRQVRQRAEGRCEYCHLLQDLAPFPLFHIEHIVPRKHGGVSETNNLCLACMNCNLHKASNLTGIDPATGEITPLFDPRNGNWAEHFQMEGAEIAGLTAIGRTTVRVLNMNSEDRVTLRQELMELGEWEIGD